MTLLLNLLLPISILLVGLVTYFFYKRSGNKLLTAGKGVVVGLFVYALYTLVQPSYIPKVGVKDLPRLPAEQVQEIPVEDRLSKPLSKEDSRKRVDEMLTAKDDIKEVLKKSKEKTNDNN